MFLPLVLVVWLRVSGDHNKSQNSLHLARVVCPAVVDMCLLDTLPQETKERTPKCHPRPHPEARLMDGHHPHTHHKLERRRVFVVLFVDTLVEIWRKFFSQFKTFHIIQANASQVV
jgi:hypothetical protein